MPDLNDHPGLAALKTVFDMGICNDTTKRLAAMLGAQAAVLNASGVDPRKGMLSQACAMLTMAANLMHTALPGEEDKQLRMLLSDLMIDIFTMVGTEGMSSVLNRSDDVG